MNRIHVRNFKSIRDQSLELGKLNVFIGGNGSGKSNLIGVFQLMNRVVNQELQTYTGVMGGAAGILYLGRKHSSSLQIELEFCDGPHVNGYQIELVPTEGDRFVFKREQLTYQDKLRHAERPFEVQLGSGHQEARLKSSAENIAQWVRQDLDGYRIYHFHDTSANAAVKQIGNLDDNRFLRPDASNLAAFLYRLQATDRTCFDNIQETIRQIAPFFDGFNLSPSRLNSDKIRLEWKERGSDAYFSASALSDGTLRFICLTVLLMQPELPAAVLLDEPELGLHPAAIVLLASLLQMAAARSQVLVATQSVTLVNQFTPDEVWVAEREDNASVFKHLARAEVSRWLESYALGELWEKNVLGGRP